MLHSRGLGALTQVTNLGAKVVSPFTSPKAQRRLMGPWRS